MKRRMAFLCLLAAGGCGAQGALLGAKGSYLFTAMDALARPGERVDLRAQLRAGDFLQGRAGYAVRFYRDGALYRVAETDAEGVAAVAFTPPQPGDYVFTAAVVPLGLADEPPAPRNLLLACRPADAPLAVVDLDRTIVATGFETVLAGDPEPMPRSQETLAALAKTHTIVYLTHRPDYFSVKSKDWLAARGYPRGPLLLSTLEGFLRGSGAFKRERIARLKKRFGRIEIGIGDKVSDALAYHANGLRAFLILQVPPQADPAACEALAADLAALPADVQVVTGWGQIADALAGKASFPPAAMRKRLADLAAAARKRAAAAPKGAAEGAGR